MKTKNLPLLIAIVLLTFATTSCKKGGCTDPDATNYDESAKKDDGSCTYINDPNSSGEAFNSLSDFYRANIKEFETFTIDASTGGSYTTEEGTTIKIPANSLADENGIITTGNTNFRIKEFYSIWDMVVNRAYTVSSGGTPLNSGGQFVIEANQNGNRLTVAPGKSITVEMPSQSTTSNMQLLNGGVSGDSIANWNSLDTSDTTSSFGFKSPNIWGINLGFLGWVNIDEYLRNNRNVACAFEISNLTFGSKTLLGFCGIMKNNHSVYSLFPNQTITEGKLRLVSNRIIPSEPSYHLLYLVHNEELYYSLMEEEPKQNATNILEMKKTTSEKLEQMLRDLKQ